MPHALPALRPSRRLVALLLALLAFGAVGLTSAPTPAAAQLLDNTAPQTKDEARAARDATDSSDGGGSIPLGVWLAIGAAGALGIATFFIFRDAGHTVRDEDRRAPVRQPVDPKDTRGVPSQMFEGEGSSSNPRGKAKKRDKGKRQKQARRANRPRR